MKFLSHLIPRLRSRQDVIDTHTAYNMIFRSPAGAVILDDLARFCRGIGSTWSPDAREHARFEGRREVWHRIMEHLNLTQEELIGLYSGQFPQSKGIDDGGQ